MFLFVMAKFLLLLLPILGERLNRSLRYKIVSMRYYQANGMGFARIITIYCNE